MSVLGHLYCDYNSGSYFFEILRNVVKVLVKFQFEAYATRLTSVNFQHIFSRRVDELVNRLHVAVGANPLGCSLAVPIFFEGLHSRTADFCQLIGLLVNGLVLQADALL